MAKYLGLDIGTNSIGWAVTDENYNLLKYNETPLWGIHLYPEASNASEARGYRSARRGTRRKAWRIKILQELFNEEVAQVDPAFFSRIRDKEVYSLFKDDKEYYEKFPTIHHLILYLQKINERPDIRYVYLMCSYYMKHRGHFYSSIDENADIEKILGLQTIFDEFLEALRLLPIEISDVNIKNVESALKQENVSNRKKALKDVLSTTDDEFKILPEIITLLSGGKAKLQTIFQNEDLKSLSVMDTDPENETMAELQTVLGEQFDILLKAKQITDWIVLCDILKDAKSINEQRLNLYEEIKSKKELRGEKLTEHMKEEHKKNRVIPYQLQWKDFKKALNNIQKFYPTLDVEKIGQLFKHRIPYFVGPLKEDQKNRWSWIKKKNDEKIYPWNFNEVINIEETHSGFIEKMTAKCTYLVGEDVLPKESMLHAKYLILNQLNNLKIDGERIDNTLKQELFQDLFEKESGTVSLKKIKAWLKSKNPAYKDTELTGVDTTIEGTLKAYHNFKPYLDKLKMGEIEEIIKRITIFGEEKQNLKSWMEKTFNHLDEEDIKKILRFSYKKYARLSREFLEGIMYDVEERELSIIQALWETNNNLMELLSDKYGYALKIEEFNKNAVNKATTLNEKLDDLYISNRVKRSIFRTLAVVSEIIKAIGKPDKIFIEMARGEELSKKGKKTKSRKDELKELLRGNKDLLNELVGKTDDQLRGKKLYLYFSQMGKCMYTGKTISLSSLSSDNWDVDHIYPRSKVKDDSIRNNLVLVDKNANGAKTDNYPLLPEIQNRMSGHWNFLKEKELITNEKYSRLMRKTPFTEDEKVNFINRQLVETRQSTKAIAQLLKEKYNVEIVYVKSELSSDFRYTYEIQKCREINDFHHAKDAYLNIVCGDVHNRVFTKNPRNFIKKANDSNYTINPKVLYKRQWDGTDILSRIRKTLKSNQIKYTEMMYERTGSFWGKTLGLIPRKGNMTEYSEKSYELSTAFFALVSYGPESNRKTKLLPVYNYKIEEFYNDANKYFNGTHKMLDKSDLDNIKFLRKVKLGTVVIKKGIRYRITGNTHMLHAYQLTMPYEQEKYFKKIIKAFDKDNPRPEVLVKEENIKLFELFKGKLRDSVYSRLSSLNIQLKWFDNSKFESLSIKEQAEFLKNSISMFTANAAKGNLKIIDKNASGNVANGPMPNDCDYILDQSVTGLFDKKYRVKV
ncbi:MAG: type II CRISPR RNA-guided endonuclease Cas9 [Candidatus Dojkabacteria bacterium]|nr:MAG: type II CRISPR RNA-guided endonuclease Cas9 [Candidatus Dojkabacteria bacterium]